ncbi:acetyl-CoA carboxylase, carboxyltransferase subunit beta [Seleniivibrio woodruffii]|uniref:Acetyl-coenzyme A carboxylase carboxyl transferase subunit beta n=1 Tax=Seleniivibrio woodruffii TaxID=1078050 RepID=A0A4V2PRC8_9BACT|nr:acetyl-CoA carboxylase, carboxyltransferase subunit beta [Seleniivibrio woodruffii]TCK58351.1 acetyl-CoA carboxylase carboxyltransferase subunit alpha [Seleniivibrio woodruffii]TVZ36725.1 acetyl-CoA carboxylase carboxyltransferase subunit alpha [Seleniivibrio woodruffii]
MGIRDFLRDKVQKVTTPDQRKEIDEKLWLKCSGCGEINYHKEVAKALQTCPKCGKHFPISAREKIDIIIDPGTFQEIDENLKSLDPLKFKDSKKYPDRVKAAVKKMNMNDAFVSGIARVNDRPVHIGGIEFGFLGGSMGSVVGEKIVRLVESAIEKNTHVITISCSGGARMQESILSLMQMAKTSAALVKLRQKGLGHISLLTDPTTGGVTASYAMLGDVNIAEPGALICFAGPRVIEQTIRQTLPEGFQRSEFLLEHGMVDMVLHREHWKSGISQVLEFFG